MKNLKQKLIKIAYILLFILILFAIMQSNMKVVFASSNRGKYLARIYDTPYTDSLGQNIFKIRVQGDDIPALKDDGFGQVAFCLNYHMDHPQTLTSFNSSSNFSENSDFLNSARIAYLGYYRYSNSNGNASASLTNRSDQVQYAFTATMIWQNLGQLSNSFSLGSEFNSFKSSIWDEFNKWDTMPSFNSSTQTLEIGESKILTDTNKVLQYYEDFEFKKDKVTFKHTKGSNDLTILVSNDVSKPTISLTKNDAINNNIGKYINSNNIKTNLVLSPLPNDTTHQRLLVAYSYNDPKYLNLNVNINLYGNVEISKIDNKGNFVPNTKFKLSYNSDMSNPIGTYVTNSNGKVIINNLKPGKIYIQEVDVPNHLILDPSISEITIKSNETSTYKAINNWKQGKIQITKKDAESNKIIKKAGTIFDIYNSNNKKISSITTNENGIAISELLDYGTYFVKESQAPDKYTIKTEVSPNINVVNNGQIYEISILNNAVKGCVTIFKEDSKTGKYPQGEATLKGAVYGLFARSSILDPADGNIIHNKDAKVAELITNNEATATISNLYLGEYYIKELIPSKGYTIDNTKHNFDLTYENQNVKLVTKNITLKEKVVSQQFQIIKISSESSGETSILPGAEFTIKSQKDIAQYGSWEAAPIAKNSDGKPASILLTDNQGYALSDKLPFGTYIVRETKVPDNKYKIEDFKVVISEDSDKPQVWRIFNDTSFTSILKIVKKDGKTGKIVTIPGTTFKIKNLDKNEYFGYWDWSPIPHYVDSWTTDSSGTVMTGDKLEVGNYQLEEIKSPYGYLISSSPIKFEISANFAHETLPDGKTPVITVIQNDTSAKGKINVEKYGEVLDSFIDGKFIYKQKGLEKAKYEIIAKEDILDPSNDGSIIYKKGSIVDTIITNAEGKATSKPLPLGQYSIKEIESPYGFVLNNEIKDICLNYKDQDTAIVFDTVTFINERQKIDLLLMKKDSDSGIGLSGAEFGLFSRDNILNNSGNIIVKSGELIETVTSDLDGYAYFSSDLPLSIFEIKELKPPIGYSSNDEIVTVDATYKGQDVVTLNLKYEFNNQITKIEISKQDISNSQEIEGAKLAVFDNDYPETPIDIWISGQDGKDENGNFIPHLIKGLEVGKKYMLRELYSPYGFTISQDIEFIVSDTGKIQTIVMQDTPTYGKLQFSKYGEIFDHTTVKDTKFSMLHTPVWINSTLLDSEITIFAGEDIIIGNITYYKKDQQIQTLKSDFEMVISKNLPVGSYYYIETKVPFGYVADTNKHYFTIENNQINDIQVISSVLYNNRPKVIINITKILEKQKTFINDNAYKDVVFGIFAKKDIYNYKGDISIPKGSLVCISTINKNGTLENIPDLPIGSYYLKELSTNSQYLLDNNEYNFEINYHGKNISEYTIQIADNRIIYNNLSRGTILVKKVDSLNDTLKIENVEFSISNRKDMKNILYTQKTNNYGITTFENLELGTYYIQETTHLDGYIINNTIYEVNLSSNGDILTIVCKNEPTRTIFSKLDETGFSRLSGATLQVIDKETGKIIDEWISTDQDHVINYLIEGKEYLFKEISAPSGYEISEEISFIMTNGKTITMKNMPIIKTDFPIVQTGNEINYILLYILTLVSLIGFITILILLKVKMKK